VKEDERISPRKRPFLKGTFQTPPQKKRENKKGGRGGGRISKRRGFSFFQTGGPCLWLFNIIYPPPPFLFLSSPRSVFNYKV
jgi:hypothetical protein